MASSPFDPTNPFGAFLNPFQAYFTGLEQMSSNLAPLKAPLKLVARCQLEGLGLMSRRAQAYMEIPTRLGQCRTAQDFAAEQQRFWQTAFSQYAESSRRMMETWGEIAGAGAMGANAAKAPDRDYIKFPAADAAPAPRSPPSPRRDQRRVA